MSDGRPLLLDLFCGAGGCAVGYHRAGFDVMGVDIEPHPDYPYGFQRGDALKALRSWMEGKLWMGPRATPIAAIHASPPCQAHSTIAKQQRALRPDTYEHPDLVDVTRDLLKATGLPYVIENVPGAPLTNAVQLCGSSFGLDVRRHRIFECSFPVLAPPCAHHWQTPRFRSLDRRHNGLASVVGVHGHLNYAGEREVRERAMDIDWMSPDDLAQAIPPAYTEHIGHYLMAEVKRRDLAVAA